MFRDCKELYKDLRKQHNIMVLVGNGFDIGILNKYQVDKYMGRTTKYSDFYDYISFYRMCSSENMIYSEMNKRRTQGISLWSDFELIIDDLLKEKNLKYEQLECDLDELQKCFSSFLQEIVSIDVIKKVSDAAAKNGCAVNSLGKFLKDLDDDSYSISFPQKTNHYDLYNFLFVNFNYTYLLDNCIYLDKNQFDPHRHKTVDRNFSFYPDLSGLFDGLANETVWSSYLLTNVVHPHGVQSISRSLIFGTELPNYSQDDMKKRFVKSYWAQNEVKYKGYFADTVLFIVYGMSLGKTDSWWLKNIYDCLLNDKAELVIYRHKTTKPKDYTKEKFINGCKPFGIVYDKDKDKIFSKIYIVDFEDNNKMFLGI